MPIALSALRVVIDLSISASGPLLTCHTLSVRSRCKKSMHQPLAIVGIGCRFPGGAVDPDSLWRLLASGTDAISEVPADRWDLRRFYHPDVTEPGKTSARHGGFLKQSLYDFDAPFFGLSSREASVADPQQRLLLEATWEAFEDAGQDCAALRGRPVGVFVGGFMLDNFLDRFGITSRDYISPSTATSGMMVMLSNRLSHAFDFVGPSLSVDTACSSSLVATHLACSSLWAGESEIAIAAGVNVMMAPEPFITMTKGGFLSPDGRCKAFDRPGTCSGSSACSLPSAIFSFHPAPTAPPLPPISTASMPWRNGKPRRMSPLEAAMRPNVSQCARCWLT